MTLITNSRTSVQKRVNSELITLYWEIGKYISDKCNTEDWGSSVVKKLSEYLTSEEPKLRGFSSQNLWRMKQFYATYSLSEKLSPLVREISWTNNLLIIGKTKSDQEVFKT